MAEAGKTHRETYFTVRFYASVVNSPGGAGKGGLSLPIYKDIGATNLRLSVDLNRSYVVKWKRMENTPYDRISLHKKGERKWD